MQSPSHLVDDTAHDPAVTFIVAKETHRLRRFRLARDRARLKRLESSPQLAQQVAAVLRADY